MQIERSSTQTHHRRRRSKLLLCGDGVQLSQLKHEPSSGLAGAHFGSVIPSGANRSRSERCGVEGPGVRTRRRKAGPSSRGSIGKAAICLVEMKVKGITRTLEP